MPLSSDQQQFVTTAQGYVDLGMYLEANEELEKMDAFVRHVPEVLQIRVQIFEKLEKWELMQVVAKKLAEYEPGNAQWWISWAGATCHAESVDAGKKVLLKSVEHYPLVALLHYHIARYECQLGNVLDARERLQTCFEFDPKMRLKALEDPDLDGVWTAI